ncbi:MAG: ArsR/SmtB family transcription factor [Saezia sp.]
MENQQSIFMKLEAQKAAAFLKMMGNEHRLHILCLLLSHEEASVNFLAEHTGLSQSAVSQHLAKMRDEGAVGFRRDSQSIYYRIQDPAVHKLIDTLQSIYCPSI